MALQLYGATDALGSIPKEFVARLAPECKALRVEICVPRNCFEKEDCGLSSSEASDENGRPCSEGFILGISKFLAELQGMYLACLEQEEDVPFAATLCVEEVTEEYLRLRKNPELFPPNVKHDAFYDFVRKVLKSIDHTISKIDESRKSKELLREFSIRASMPRPRFILPIPPMFEHNPWAFFLANQNSNPHARELVNQSLPNENLAQIPEGSKVRLQVLPPGALNLLTAWKNDHNAECRKIGVPCEEDDDFLVGQVAAGDEKDWSVPTPLGPGKWKQTKYITRYPHPGWDQYFPEKDPRKLIGRAKDLEAIQNNGEVVPSQVRESPYATLLAIRSWDEGAFGAK
ncbi:MAG: hypothetical protein M1820_006327 [Bogoriella megaspora]|nr:MAG: hypothetical protein M1820_006327 [Bogoriella megaspora]